LYEEKTKKQHFPENKKKGHAEHHKNVVIILVA
jgi:hypothetical protein